MKYSQLFLIFFGILLLGIAFASDTTPPTTTFTSHQNFNTSDQNITLTCTDTNTGCKTINYNIDSLGLHTITLSDFNVLQTDINSTEVSTSTNVYAPLLKIDLNSLTVGNFVNTATLLQKRVGAAGTADAFIQFKYSDGTDFNTNNQTESSTSYVLHTYTNTTPTKAVTNIIAWVRTTANGNEMRFKDLNSTYTKQLRYLVYPYNFIFAGAGIHSIQYYSIDNNNNTEVTNTSSFTTYGTGHFYFYDENNGTVLNGVTVTSTNGDNNTLVGHQFDANFQTISTSTTIRYTFSKSGYGTRYYERDINDFTDFNINFALLPVALGSDIQFRFYKTDQVTAYANIYVQVKDTNTNYILGRLPTDSTGLVTFNLDQNATGLQFDMNNGENTYNAVVLTILKPKNEQTLLDIAANWSYQISGLASYVDLNVPVGTSSKIFAIYSNTISSYSVTIGSNSLSPVYASRKYDIQVFGNTSTYTLTPYLIDASSAVTTTLYTINAYTNQAIGNIGIKIYRNLPGLGKTIIEQSVTDSKGQSLVYLLLNQTYQFELNVGTTFVRTETYTISSTSSQIYFKVDPGYDLNSNPQTTSVFAFMSPGKNWLSTSDGNISANVSYGTNQNSVTVQSIQVKCYNDTNTLFTDNFSLPTMNFVQTYDFNATTKTLNSVPFDGNYPILCTISVGLSDGNIVTASQQYVVTNNLPQNNLGFNLRPAFGCIATNDASIPCPGMILGALFITMMGVAGIMIESGFTYPEFAGILFMIGLGFFTFFTWIPPILFVIVVAIGIFIYAALGVRRI